MKLAAVLALLPLALAAPQQSSLNTRELPNLTPVNVLNFDADFDIKCGRFLANSQVRNMREMKLT